MLYSQVHTSTGTYEYELHTQDVPLVYTSTVYNPDNTIKHMVNEAVLDTDGQPVYAFRAGDIKLDERGNPITVGTLELMRYINLLFIDYKATISDKKIIKDYRDYLKTYLTEKIVDNATIIQDELLENTKAFVVVPKNVGYVKVKTPTKTTYISSMQNFRVNVYVSQRVYTDNVTRDSIVYTVISEIDQYLYNNKMLSKTELLNILYEKMREFVHTVSLDNFTELDEEYIQVLDENARISLNKLLVDETGSYNLVDDVTVNFVLA
jgi:hypothetical protein